MRMCLINDCNINSQEPAMCCQDCNDRDVCPDRCPRNDTVYCVGVIEDYNDKNQSRIIKKKSMVYR